MPTASIHETSASGNKNSSPGGGALTQQMMHDNPQDAYIYNSSARFFEQTKHRYTRFANEIRSKEVYMSFGRENSVQLDSVGNLIMNCFLEIELPSHVEPGSMTWRDDVGLILLKKMYVKIGEQVFTIHERLFNDILKRTMASNRKKATGAMYGSGLSLSEPRVIFIPLHLFSMRSVSELYFLPMYQNNQGISITFDIEAIENCVVNGTQGLSTIREFTAHLCYECIHLDDMEKYYLHAQPSAYLIDAMKDAEALNISETTDGSEILTRKIRVQLNEINFAVTHIFIVAYSVEDVANNTFFNYLDVMEHVKLIIDGKEIVDSEIEALNIDSYESARLKNDNVYTISFAKTLVGKNPEGYLDFGKFKNKELHVLLRDSTRVVVKAFAIGYSSVEYSGSATTMLYEL